MARLSHPNIVAVYDAGQTASGLLYFVMEFVEGTDVAQLLAREGRLVPECAVPIIMAVCEALAFAHKEGIIHRDIKPSNVMIDQRGRVKVADFGLAKTINVESTMITRSDVAMGTPDFVAPEALIPGIAVDGRADLYAVGVMLYQMLTGQIPRGRFALPSGVIPQVDARFDTIVDRAMQTDRERRYTTATEMRKEMERVVTAPLAAPSATSGAVPGKKGRSLLLPALGAITVLGAGAWLVLGKKQPGAGSAPSSSPSSTAGEKTAQIEARPSKATAPPDNPGSALFIPGKWISTSAKQWQSLKGNPEFRANGEMKLGGAVMLADFTAAGVFMRGKVRLPAGSGYTFVHLRESGQDKRTLSIRRLPAKADGWSLQVNDDGKHDDVAPLQSPNFDQLADGEGWIVFELGTVGKTSFARFGSGQWVRQTDDRLVARGTVTLSGDNATFRDLEILNLDGLPEAEALQAAGVPSPPPNAPNSPANTSASVKAGPWINVTADVKQNGLERNLLTPDGEWLTAQPGIHYFPVSRDMVIADSAVRVVYRDRVQVKLRQQPAANRFAGYIALADKGQGGIFTDVDPSAKEWLKSIPDSGKADRSDQEHELVFAAYGDQLIYQIDGKTIARVRDARFQKGKMELATLMDEANVPALTQIKKVEYMSLDGLSEAEALKVAGISSSAPQWRDALAEGQLKSAVTKITKSPTGYALPPKSNWVFPSEALQAGAIRWRGVVRNGWPELAVKESDQHQFLLGISRSTRRPYIADKNGSQVKNLTEAEEYAGFQPKDGEVSELTVTRVGGKLSLIINGRLACEAAIPQTGRAQFAIILHEDPVPTIQSLEYINLDGLPEAEALKLVGVPSSSATTWGRRDFATFDDKGGSVPDEVREGELLHLRNDRMMSAPDVKVRDGAVRAALVYRSPFQTPRLVTRVDNGQYHLTLRRSDAIISFYDRSEKPLKTFPLPKPLEDGEEFTAQFASIGTRHYAWFNGTLLGSVEDAIKPESGRLAIQSKDAYFKNMEWLPLDGLSETEALKLVGAPTSRDAKSANPAVVWQDVLREPSRLRFAGEASLTPQGLLFTDAGNVTIQQGPSRNGGIRMKAVHGKLRVFPRVRASSSGCYESGVLPSGKEVELRRVTETGLVVSLGKFSLPTPPNEGQEYELDLRIAGDRLAVFFNGTLLGRSVTDKGVAEGGWQLNTVIHDAPPTLVKSLEVLNLDGLPEAEALKLMGAESVASATGSTRRPEWLDVTEEIRTAGLRDGALKTDGMNLAAIQKRGFTLAGGRSFADAAVRVSFSGSLSIKLRQSDSTAAYSAYVPAGSAPTETVSGRMNYNAPRQEVNEALGDWGKAAARGGDGMQEIIFAVQGNKLTLALNGRIVSTATDARLASGRVELTVMPDGDKGGTALSKVQIVDLAGLSEAEALKAVGVEATPAYRFPDGPPGFVKELTGHKGEVTGSRSLAILPDGRRMFTHAGRDPAGADVNEAILWDLESGQPIWKRQLLDTRGVVGGSALLSAANQVAVIHRGTEFTLEFLDLDSGRTLRQAKMETPVTGQFVSVLVPAPDARRFMVLLYQSKVEVDEPMLFQLWDAQAQTPLATWEVAEKGFLIHSAAWLDDRRYVVNAHKPNTDFRFHFVLDVTQPGQVRRVEARNDDVEFGFAPVPGQPDQILTHRRGGGLAFYDLAKSSIIRSFSMPRVQRQLTFMDSQRVLGLSDLWGDALRLWDTTSGQLLWELKDERLCDALAVSPDGRFAVTNSWVRTASGQNRPDTKLLIWRLPKADARPQPGMPTQAP